MLCTLLSLLFSEAGPCVWQWVCFPRANKHLELVPECLRRLILISPIQEPLFPFLSGKEEHVKRNFTTKVMTQWGYPRKTNRQVKVYALDVKLICTGKLCVRAFEWSPLLGCQARCQGPREGCWTYRLRRIIWIARQATEQTHICFYSGILNNLCTALALQAWNSIPLRDSPTLRTILWTCFW